MDENVLEMAVYYVNDKFFILLGPIGASRSLMTEQSLISSIFLLSKPVTITENSVAELYT